MATVETELKTLNKNVTDAVNILKAYVVSSSNMKNITGKQKEVVDKWLEIVDTTEEDQKKQRAFTERERDANGRFIKKRDKSTSMFLNMAKSVGGMFSKMTMGVSSSIGNFASGLKNNLSGFFQSVKSQFLGLFGEESEWFDLLGSIKDSVKGISGSILNFLFKKTPNWAKEQIKILKKTYNLQLKQMKMDFLNAAGGKKKKSGFGSALSMILVGIAASIGAWMHRKLVVLTKLFPIFEKLSKAFSLLEDLPFIGKVFKVVRKAFGYISELFPIVIKKLPFFGKLIEGFKVGFKWLGWPITILLSVIDFIKGFNNTEGTLWEKIKGGLWEALKGFIDLPVQFIGWVVEKVAGLFGIKLTGVGDSIMGFIHSLFNMILDGWKMIFDLIKPYFSMEGIMKIVGFLVKWNPISIFFRAWKWLVSKVYDLFSSTTIGKKVLKFISPIINFFSNLWNKISEWLISKIPSWLPKGIRNKIISNLKGSQHIIQPTTGGALAGASVIDMASEVDKTKINKGKEKDKEMEKALNNIGESIKQSNKQNAESINAISSMQGNNLNGGGGEAQQIPDEVDNWGMAMFNYAGGS